MLLRTGCCCGRDAAADGMLPLMLRAVEAESVATVVRISAQEKGGGAVGGRNTLHSKGGGG